MRKKIMKGVIARMFTLVSERMRVHEAIQELIDNSIDAKAKNINITLDSTNDVFVCEDDGNGMNSEQVNVYADDYISHMPTSEASIGKFGAGSKDAIIKIADHIRGSEVAITSWTNKDEISKLRFNVDAKKEEDFRSPEIDTYSQEKWADEHGPHGHMVSIKHIKDIDSKDKQWKSNLKKECSKAYSYIINKYGINISINGEKLECIDRMHLDILGDDINECGVYFKNNMVFAVKTYTLRNLINQSDKRDIKVVYLYIAKEGASIFEDDNNFGYCGVYPILGNRYLKVPKDNETGLPFAIGYRGGTGRCRACVFVDGNEDIFGLKSKKSDGIDLTKDNIKLSKYRVVNYEDDTFSMAFEKDFKKLNSFASFQSDGNANRTLTVDVAKKIFKGTSLKELEAEYDGISKKDETKEEKKVKAKAKSMPTIAPTSITEEEETNLKNQVDEELQAVCASVDEPSINHQVIELYVDKTSGKTEYNYTEYKPEFCNEEYVDKLFRVLIEEGIPKAKIARICSKMAYSFAK